MYISEHYGWDTNRLRRIAVRPHGFASVSAGADKVGEILTRPLLFKGKHLRLNYATSAAGSLRIVLQQASYEIIPGYGLKDMNPVFGDRLDEVVSWRSNRDVSALQGQPARLRIQLMDADVFALRFA